MSNGNLSRVDSSIVALKSAVTAGRLASWLSTEDHVREAERVRAAHAAQIDSALASLRALSPDNAKVKGRVKELESVIGKLARKPKYGTAACLQDTTGLRVICRSLTDVATTVARIQTVYAVIEQDDYISCPKDGYRSFHLIVRSGSNLQTEIQVRTVDQNTHADWSHKAYKPKTAAQKAALATHGVTISNYSHAVSDYFHACALGGYAVRPVAPAVVVSNFGECR